eukprot:5447-Heterococcus_DN1.PRE.2
MINGQQQSNSAQCRWHMYTIAAPAEDCWQQSSVSIVTGYTDNSFEWIVTLTDAVQSICCFPRVHTPACGHNIYCLLLLQAHSQQQLVLTAFANSLRS